MIEKVHKKSIMEYLESVTDKANHHLDFGYIPHKGERCRIFWQAMLEQATKEVKKWESKN